MRRLSLAIDTDGQVAERGAAKDGCEGWKAWSIHYLEASAGYLHETSDKAVRVEGRGLRASTAADHSSGSFGSDDCNGLHAGWIQGKQSAFILEKGDTFERFLECNFVRVGVVERNRRDRLDVSDSAELYRCTKDAAALFIQHGHGQFAAGEACLLGLGRHQLCKGHLE